MEFRHHALFYGSSYDRGLQHLLKMWPKIREKFPDATLHIAYGWNTFDSFFKDNPERQAWKKTMEDLMAQPGITHHGRLGKDELKQLRQKCGIWAYPTHFQEIFCISAVEAQADGCVPCVIDYAALSETVQSGVKIKGDIYDPETKDAYLSALFNLMSDESEWKAQQAQGMEWAKSFLWEKIAKKWQEHF